MRENICCHATQSNCLTNSPQVKKITLESQHLCYYGDVLAYLTWLTCTAVI